MKAIRVREFGPPEVMKVEMVPDPRPGLGQVLVDLRAAGVNPVDAYIRSGTYRPDLALPYTPGIDGAGIVAAVGPEVTTWRPGQRVYLTWAVSGSYAERVLCAAGVDIILEMLANVNLGHDLRLLAKGGRVVVIGSRGTVEIDPRETMGRDAAILGMVLFNTPVAELARVHAALGAGLQQGTLRPVVSRELPLAEAATAHHAILESSSLGKLVLIP